MKKWRAEIEIDLSDNHFQMARELAQIEPLFEDFKKQLPEGVKVTESVVNARGPKAPKKPSPLSGAAVYDQAAK
jgi:hypothetical protein